MRPLHPFVFHLGTLRLSGYAGKLLFAVTLQNTEAGARSSARPERQAHNQTKRNLLVKGSNPFGPTTLCIIRVRMDCLRREYPTKPIVGVGAVIISSGKILLAKRGSEPGKGKWSIPGGLVELGEMVRHTVVREVKEECNLDVEVHSLIDVVDNLIPDEAGNWRYHFIILDFFARVKGECKPVAGSDVLALRWVSLDEAGKMNLTETFREFLQRNREILQQFNSKR